MYRKTTATIQEIDTMSNTKPVRLARRVLTEISGDNQSLESLRVLLEVLENKFEPSRDEINIVSTMYQIVEKMKLLESYLAEYTKDNKEKGDLLNDLYSNARKVGTSNMFDY